MDVITIHAGCNLSDEEFNDDTLKTARLRDIEQMIAHAHIAGLQKSTMLNSVCILVCKGSSEALDRLKELLDENQLSYEEECPREPTIRPAHF